MSYSAHETLVAPARPKAELWRLLVGVGMAATGYLVLTIVLFGAIDLASGGTISPGGASGTYATSPSEAIVLLASFACMIGGVMLAAWAMQERKLRSMIGPLLYAFRDFMRVMRLLVPLAAFFFVMTWVSGDLRLNMPPGLWALLLPVSLALVLLQVSAEEIAFRGYLQSQLAARFKSPIIWIGVPSLLFALGHYSPSEAGDNALLITIWAFVFGLLAADLTARTGTLGAAIGLHFSNNVLALVFVALDGSLSGLALFTLPFSLADGEVVAQMLPLDFVAMVCSYLVARIALRI